MVLIYSMLVVAVLTITRITKSVVTGQAPVTLELEYPREKTLTNQRWYTDISQLDAIHASARNIQKVNRESAYVVPGPHWCVRLTARA